MPCTTLPSWSIAKVTWCEWHKKQHENRTLFIKIFSLLSVRHAPLPVPTFLAFHSPVLSCLPFRVRVHSYCLAYFPLSASGSTKYANVYGEACLPCYTGWHGEGGQQFSLPRKVPKTVKGTQHKSNDRGWGTETARGNWKVCIIRGALSIISHHPPPPSHSTTFSWQLCCLLLLAKVRNAIFRATTNESKWQFLQAPAIPIF